MKKQNINPDHIINVVDAAFRHNPLSRHPGGVTLLYHYEDGRLRAYENIKNPQAYIRSSDLTGVAKIQQKAHTPSPGTTSYSLTLLVDFTKRQKP